MARQGIGGTQKGAAHVQLGQDVVVDVRVGEIGGARNQLRDSEIRPILAAWDGCYRRPGDGIEDSARIATDTAQVAAAKTPKITIGGAIGPCAACQGTAVVILNAEQHVPVRPGVAPEPGEGPLGGIATCGRRTRARFEAFEVFTENDIHDPADGV